MRWSAFVILFSIFLFPSDASSEEIDAGFVQGLWYSKEPVFVGESVRIYVALRNNTDSDLTGTVVFKDKDTVIAEKEFSAISGRLIEAWADWTPEFGSHNVTASLSSVFLNGIGVELESVTVQDTLIADSPFVDFDTDGDGIGNEEDLDDDNDLIPDIDEIAAGTDPLTPNEDQSESTDAEVEEETSETPLTQDTGSEGAETSLSFREGLERFTDEGAIDSLLSDVTRRTHEAKSSLDEYREDRKEEKEAPKNPVLSTLSTSSDSELATITRSRIEEEKPGLIASMIGGLLAIVNGIYTLILWIISHILAHPAVVQLVLLIGILLAIYKTARRLAQRQNQ